MVKRGDLQNRAETGESIKGEAAVVEAIEAMRSRPPSDAERLAALEARIEAARALTPPRGIEDGRCWGMGRDAVLHAITGE